MIQEIQEKEEEEKKYIKDVDVNTGYQESLNSRNNPEVIEDIKGNANSLVSKNNDNNVLSPSTKNKHGFWIKFFTFLKWIAFIGSVLAAIITITAILSAAFPAVAGFIATNFSWIAPIFASYLKPAIVTAIAIFTFAVSKLIISRLSNGKPKENGYPEQIDTSPSEKNEKPFDKTLERAENMSLLGNIINNLTNLKETKENKNEKDQRDNKLPQIGDNNQ